MGIKKLDWYIIKKFLGSFIVALGLLTVIVIIFDVSEKIDDFVQKEAPLKAIVVDYYLNFIPYFMNMYSPMVVFLTVILFTSKMAQNSEIVAILSCGVSFHRMMVPYLVSACIVALVSMGLGLWVIPRANVTRVAFEQKYNPRAKDKFGHDMHYKLEDNKFVYLESFSSWNNTAYNFTLEQISDDHMISKLSAESAQWDSLSGKWKLRNWFIRDYGEGLQDRIRSAFPYLLEIRREGLRKADYHAGVQSEAELDPFELCCTFLGDLDDDEKALLQEVINQVRAAE